MRRWWRRLMEGFVVVRPHTHDAACWCRSVVGADCWLASDDKAREDA